MRPTWRAALARTAILLGFWIVLIGVDPADTTVGVAAAAIASGVGLRLRPSDAPRLRVPTLPRLALRFLWESLVAGADVARRALDPQLPLRPGLVHHPVGSPPGPWRDAFAAFTSMAPGTVVVAEDEAGLVYHCLDLDRPMAEQLASAEALLRRSLSPARP